VTGSWLHLKVGIGQNDYAVKDIFLGNSHERSIRLWAVLIGSRWPHAFPDLELMKTVVLDHREPFRQL
jgi:hypothetical protein